MDFITKLLYILLLSSIMSSTLLGDEQDDSYIRFENTLSLHTNQVFHDFSWVTPQIRMELIQDANAKIRISSTSDFVPPKEVLLWLGDDSTIQEAISTYRKADGSQNIWGPPEILPYLIEDLTHASPNNPNPLGCSPMDQSVKSAYSIIATWLAFPSATRNWAQRVGFNFPLHGTGSDAPENYFLREWWKHNKDAVLSRQYNKANWLPSGSEEAQAYKKAAVPSIYSQSTVAKVSSSPVLTQAPNDLPIPLWIYGVIVLSLGSIGGAWYFLRSKK